MRYQAEKERAKKNGPEKTRPFVSNTRRAAVSNRSAPRIPKNPRRKPIAKAANQHFTLRKSPQQDIAYKLSLRHNGMPKSAPF
jgi:hypothetical protein